MITIGSNIQSLGIVRRLSLAVDQGNTALERLSTGMRINRASDDAAGTAISMSLKVDARVYSQAVRNLNDGISLSNIAQGAVQQLSGIATRLMELSEQAANGTYSTSQRTALSNESDELIEEYNRIISTTVFNGVSIYQASENRNISFQAGYGVNEILTMNFGSGLARPVGTGTFAAGSVYATNGNSQNLSGDLNGDGFDDIVNNRVGGSTQSILVSISNGDGTFQNPVVYTSPGTANRLQALADLDGDGILDIVSADYTNDTMLIYYGNGNGTFQAATSLSVGYDASGAAVHDLNGDGFLDIAFDNGNSQVGVFLSQSGRSYSSMTSYTGSSGSRVLFGEFTGDSRVDIAVVSSGGLYVYGGNGNGTFSARTFEGVTGDDTGAVSDIDGNGLDDVIGSDYGTGAIWVKLQTSPGTFSASTDYQAIGPNDLRGLSFVDYDDDGHGDLIVTGDGGTIVTLRGNSDGSFQAAVSSTGFSDINTAVGDFNGDGVWDIANAGSTSGNMTIGLGNYTTTPFIKSLDLSSAIEARISLDMARRILDRVSIELGHIGAAQSRFETAISTLQTRRQGYIQAESRISDADVAAEAANQVKSSVVAEYASFVLSQSNLAPQIALSLIIEAN